MSIEISDSAVEAAVSAAKKEAGGGLQTLTRWEMRAAIVAAMGESLEVVGWEHRVWWDQERGWGYWHACHEDDVAELKQTRDVQVRPLYTIKQGASRG